MSNARDKANIPALNFSSTGIDDNATSTAITIDSSQQVGIGTASPATNLEIRNASAPATFKLVQSGAGQFTITAESGLTTIAVPDAGGSLAFDTGGTSERMRIESSGLVRVGNTSHTNSLISGNFDLVIGNESSGASGLAILAPSNENSYLGFFDNNNSGSFRGALNYNHTNDYLRFYTSGSERMRINSSGQTLIGTTVAPTNADTKLMVHTPISSSSRNVIEMSQNTNGANKVGAALGLSIDNGGESTNAASLLFKTASGGSLSERMRILSNGRVCINRTSSVGAAKLDISHPGSTEYGLTLDSSNTSGTQYHLDIRRGGTQAGYLVSSSATAVNLANASDERLKENIQNSGSAIQDIKNIQVRQFDWKDGIDTHRDFGFVAQELVNVVPEAVTQGTDELDENGKPVKTWGVDYSHIVPRLVKVCQEQQTKIEELEARITALETNNP